MSKENQKSVFDDYPKDFPPKEEVTWALEITGIRYSPKEYVIAGCFGGKVIFKLGDRDWIIQNELQESVFDDYPKDFPPKEEVTWASEFSLFRFHKDRKPFIVAGFYGRRCLILKLKNGEWMKDE